MVTTLSAPDAVKQITTSVPADSQSRVTWMILGAALFARLLFMLVIVTSYPRNWLFTRGVEMGLLADNLIHGLGYSSPFGGVTGPTAFIAPGYPTMVAAVFLVFGSYSFASEIVIITAQILISVLTLWLMMHIARKVFDPRTAKLAGAFWAVSIPLLWMPTIFWETSISACAFVGSIALALRFRDNPGKTSWMLMGAYCGIIALINPALMPSLLAIMGWLAWQTRRLTRTAPLLGLLTLLIVFAPWPIRNAYRFHAFIPLRSTVGFELWMGNRPGATGYLEESLFPMFNKQELASYNSEGEVAYTHSKSEEAWRYIRANPRTFADMTARRVFRFWAGTGNAHGSPIYSLHAVLTSIFGFIGLAFVYRRRSRAIAVLMALPILLFPLPYYITHAEFRYRLNIDPLMTILAACAVTQLACAWSRRRSHIRVPQTINPEMVG
jgi:hypothetical protein